MSTWVRLEENPRKMFYQGIKRTPLPWVVFEDYEGLFPEKVIDAYRTLEEALGVHPVAKYTGGDLEKSKLVHEEAAK